jgi:hypothetical protein
VLTACVLAAAACLAVAIAAGGTAYAMLTRKPTSAELSAAAAAGAASRWQRSPAGEIFPAGLGYTTDLLTQETARRIGISPAYGCAGAVDAAVAGLVRRDGCRAALRATYLDQLQGVVYTLGVLAFPGPREAAAFLSRYHAGRYPLGGLRALAIPGTAAARFGDAARQAASAQQAGPYVVLTVAGYADGRPGSAAGGRRPSVFTPATQLAAEVGAPLSQPMTVNCAGGEWSC